LNGGQNVALELLNVRRLKLVRVPFGSFCFALPHRSGPPLARLTSMGWIGAFGSQAGECYRAGGGEAGLLFGTEAGEAVVAVGAVGADQGCAAAAATTGQHWLNRLRVLESSPNVVTTGASA